MEAIRSFSMAQIANAPSIFRHCLSSQHISQCLTTMVPVAFTGEMKETLRLQAQFKLFSLVEMLQKIKFGASKDDKKGFVEGTDKLWLAVANAKIHSLIKDSEETATIAKQQKRVLKYLKTEVTPLRVRLFAEGASQANLERKIKIETDAKKTLAVEKLILSLTLTMCVPGVDMRDLTDTLEQIEDIMECFKQLGLGNEAAASNPKKKAKKETSESQQRKKALAVLFDLLIAQLTKSQSFLREMANYVFKQFCGELDEASLDHLLEIVAKPVANNDLDMLEEDSESGSEDDSEGEDAQEEVAMDDDDSDL